LDILAVVLPILSFVALLKKDNLRESFLNSAIAIGLFVVFSTEMLSWFKLIAYLPLVVCWSLYLLSVLAWRYRAKTALRMSAGEIVGLPEKGLLALIAMVVGVSGVAALVAAPNNFDSLTYHLPRIMHWIQNSSVAHYPTNVDRQLVLAPLSEFMMMHLQILSGSDRFANCVQWFSMVGSAVGVSLIARALSGSLQSQIVTAAIAVSLPMGLLQSTSTQNDYAVTLWLVCLAYYIIKAKQCGGTKNTLLEGICLGLAILTKGTAYLIAAPFMLLYLWHLVTKGTKTAVTSMLIVALAVLLINGSHYGRNFRVYGSPLSSGTGNDIISKRVDAGSIISGVAKNVATQLATGMQGANAALLVLTNAVHGVLGVSVNDPELASDNFYLLPAEVLNHEDYAPNPLHMVLLLVSGGLLVLRRKQISREVMLLAAACTLSFIILSLSLKWTPYLSRYFVPVFVLSAPAVALLFDGMKWRLLVSCCALLLLVSGGFVLANNKTRPLVGQQSVFVTKRLDQYFMGSPRAEMYFLSVASMAKAQPIRNIGITNSDGNMLEYLLWVLMNDGSSTYRIEHVDVKNPSGSIKLIGFSPYYPVSI
jgi:4-amino-4-deoxy-L-arabinose transferase-like glycosyltransferase